MFANDHNRDPLAKANTQFINNVVYDYQAGYTAGNSSGHFSPDVIGNYFIAGPVTTSPSNAYFQMADQSVCNSGNDLDTTTDGVLNGQVIANVTSLGRAGSLWSSQQATGLVNDGYGNL